MKRHRLIPLLGVATAYLLVATGFGATPCPASTQKGVKATQGTAYPDVPTAERTARAFLIALINQDAEALRRLVFLTDVKDVDLLLQGTPPLPGARKQITEQFRTLSFEVLLPGDRIPMPDGKPFTVPEPEPNSECVYLMADAAFFPIVVIKTDAGWRIDITQIVARKKATQAAKTSKAERRTNPAAFAQQRKTVRALFIALGERDAKALKNLILPVSPKEFALLVAPSGRPPSPADNKRFRANVAAAIIKELKPGDTFDFRDGKRFVLPALPTGKEAAYLTIDTLGSPILLVKANGRWLAGAAPMIASRKVARAAGKAGSLDAVYDAARKASGIVEEVP